MTESGGPVPPIEVIRITKRDLQSVAFSPSYCIQITKKNLGSYVIRNSWDASNKSTSLTSLVFQRPRK